MENTPLYGAAREYLAAKYGGMFTEDDGTVTANTTASQAAGNAPDRMGLLFVNLSANTVYLGISPTPGSSNGIALSPNGGSASFNVDEDYTLVTRQWNCTAPGGASTVYVLELLREIRTGNPLEVSR